jgi:hypothetical protein
VWRLFHVFIFIIFHFLLFFMSLSSLVERLVYIWLGLRRRLQNTLALRANAFRACADCADDDRRSTSFSSLSPNLHPSRGYFGRLAIYSYFDRQQATKKVGRKEMERRFVQRFSHSFQFTIFILYEILLLFVVSSPSVKKTNI